MASLNAKYLLSVKTAYFMSGGLGWEAEVAREDNRVIRGLAILVHP